jgi:thioredoxin 1
MTKTLVKLFRGTAESDHDADPVNGTGPVHVTDDDFQNRVLESDLPVVVDFWAPWCMPCRMISPLIERLANDYQGRLLVAKVNTDENPNWATRYGIQGIPTMLFIKNGQVMDRIVGVSPAGRIKQRVETIL